MFVRVRFDGSDKISDGNFVRDASQQMRVVIVATHFERVGIKFLQTPAMYADTLSRNSSCCNSGLRSLILNTK